VAVRSARADQRCAPAGQARRGRRRDPRGCRCRGAARSPWV